MIDAKKIGLIVVMVLASVLAVLTYWNQHLYYQATAIEENENKVKVLNKAESIYPLNDLVFFELGKAYFNLGIQSLGEAGGLKEDYFRESIRNLERSIEINPVSYLSHFYYAQSLDLMDYISPSEGADFYEEFKKAAFLAGHDNEIFYEVGRVFLSKWEDLSEEDRRFTLEILGEVLKHEDGTKFEAVLHLWEMNVKDHGVIEAIIPRRAPFYRMYAKFLGEKSLSREERLRALAMAEGMEFDRAKEESAAGDREMAYFQFAPAVGHYEECLRILERIRFYQDLGGGDASFDPFAFKELKKSVYLKLAKALVRQGQAFRDIEGYLRSYLGLEDKVSELNDLETFLKERNLISARLEPRADDLGLVAFQAFLYFKQARYREITGLGNLIKQSFVAVPENQMGSYIKLLQLIGESFQKSGSLYGGIDYFREALERDENSLSSLRGLRGVYERMNDEVHVQEIDQRIEKLVSPREVEVENPLLEKGKAWTRRLIFDGREATLDLVLGEEAGETTFLSVVFNGRVVWEDYVEGSVVSIPVQTELGQNILSITPLNRALTLNSIIWGHVT